MLMIAELVVVFAALFAVMERRTGLAERAMWFRPPAAAVALWLCVAAISTMQFVVDGWYDALFRDPDRILHQGQVWRLLTAMFVQDGWATGMAFNLVILALGAIPAARYFGGRTMWAVFLGGGLLFNLLGAAFGSSGAGNSGATLGLVCAVVGHVAASGLVRRGSVAASTIAVAVVPLLVGAAAWVFFDYHGEAEVIGWLVGAVLGVVAPQRFPKQLAV